MEIFAAIIRHGSFRRAADRLGITPEAVSANIRALEGRLSYELFERHVGGPATLTGPGERAYQFASNILDDLSYLYDASDRTAARRVVVGAHPYIMRYLQAGIDSFRVSHSDVLIDMDIDSSGTLGFPEKAERRMVDLGYYFSVDDGGELPPAHSLLMKREPLGIFVSRDHPLASKPVVSVADLSALPAIHLSQRTALRPLIDRVLETYGLGEARVGVETDDYGHILTSTQRGEGYVCMFASAQDEHYGGGAIKMLSLERPLPALQIRRASRSLGRGALVTQLEAHLRETFRHVEL
nr:LysR family transcriptional regulator [Sphingobium xanthum]